jgi:DNA-binding protein H-NS
VRRLLHRLVENKMVGIPAPDQYKGLSAIAGADRLDETDLAALTCQRPRSAKRVVLILHALADDADVIACFRLGPLTQSEDPYDYQSRNAPPVELQALIKNAEAQMESVRKNHVKEVRTKIDGILASAGLTIREVYPTRGGKHKAAVAPKYRNPDNTAQTWSGRGKRPTWFVIALKKKGMTAESLQIAGATAKATPAKKAAKKTPAKKKG